MDAIDRFLRYISAELNFSPNTVAAYRRDLESWRDHATAGGRRPLDAASMTPSDLRTWLAAKRRRECSAMTLKRRLSSLRSFYRYMMRHEGLGANPAAELVAARLPKPLPVSVRPAETASMLDSADEDAAADDATFVQIRDALILEMFYATGMRCSELIDLRDADVSTTRMTLTVMGKRRKERQIPMTPRVAAMTRRYRQSREETVGTSTAEAFFVRPDGQPLYRKLVYNIVHDAMTAAGVHASRLSPHVMRHSCATDLLNGGADLESVRSLLGHASLATTQIYTHLSYRDLQHNYQLAHPRAQKTQ